MKKLSIATVFAASFLLFSLPPARALAQERVSIEYFYTSLEPYGEWIEAGDYGLCWHPSDVDSDWQPYTVGRWVYTDQGWTWVSEEPFGWIVFHYGRWVNITDVGWCWVPDTDWAPAWVSFRNSDDYIGWAPLPPEARLWASISLTTWVDAYYDLGPTSYCFVPYARFTVPLDRRAFLRRDRNIEFFESTINVTNTSLRGGAVFVSGPDFDRVSSRSEIPIRQLRLERQTDVGSTKLSRDGAKSKIMSDRLMIPAPSVTSKKEAAPPKVARRLSAATVDHGWAKAGDPSRTKALKEKIKSEAKTPDALPPKPKYDKSMHGPQRTPDSQVMPPSEGSKKGGKELKPTKPSTPVPDSNEIKPQKPESKKALPKPNEPDVPKAVPEEPKSKKVLPKPQEPGTPRVKPEEPESKKALPKRQEPGTPRMKPEEPESKKALPKRQEPNTPRVVPEDSESRKPLPKRREPDVQRGTPQQPVNPEARRIPPTQPEVQRPAPGADAGGRRKAPERPAVTPPTVRPESATPGGTKGPNTDERKKKGKDKGKEGTEEGRSPKP